MKTALIALLILIIATASLGYDLGSQAPAKPAAASHQAPPPDPDVIRQGGDTLADAILLAIPAVDIVGSTAGYANDYDEACPYTDAAAPDVVYKLAPLVDTAVDIDMLGSAYDTKIYVYREDFTVVACNDDFYPDYVSKLENVLLEGDVKYFLVIDGYGSESGEYVLNIVGYAPYILDCPPGAQLEGEPPLVDGYIDLHNGGCNTEGVEPFGVITQSIFCGVSGWYLSPDGSQFRDTDWFEIWVPSWMDYVEISGEAEVESFMFELGPMDCDNVGVIQQATFGPGLVGELIIPAEPGSTIWFWVGPTTFDGTGEYNYVLQTSVGWNPAVRTETQTWSAVKELFR